MLTSSSSETPGRRLRTLIHAPAILVLPGVFDGFSTRLVSKLGYPAAFITGSGVSESRLGQPDVGLMGLDENVAAARAMAACSPLLLLADADTGYGNALNAYHTVRAFERAGATARASNTQGDIAVDDGGRANHRAEAGRSVVASGDADLVAMARAKLCNPRWPWHAAATLGAQICAPQQYWRSAPREASSVLAYAKVDAR